MLIRTVTVLLSFLLLTIGSVIADDASELKELQGPWEVTELVEDGKVIPRDAIREWLPSGGKIEIEENAMIFNSPDDGKKHVKVFSIDATTYPRSIDLNTREKKDGWGIYRMDNGRLIVCLAHPEEAQRPTEFSAKEGSKQMLMVLERPAKKTEPAEPVRKDPPSVAARVLTDAQVTQMLHGTWRYSDNAGVLVVTFDPNGSFKTVREVKEIRLFQKVFVQAPISEGQWSVRNGQIAFVVLKSVRGDRVNREFDFTVRSITDKDFIFVDHLGRVGQAAKVR